MEKVYSLKIIYNSGDSKVLGGRAAEPQYLYAVFDGMIDEQEYQSISASHPSSSEVLIHASRIFKSRFKDLARIEIINIKTNTIVDFINC